jgi:hypothetical protein
VKHTSKSRSQIISNPKQNKKLKKWQRKRERERVSERSGNTFIGGEMIETEERGK